MWHNGKHYQPTAPVEGKPTIKDEVAALLHDIGNGNVDQHELPGVLMVFFGKAFWPLVVFVICGGGFALSVLFGFLK